MRYTFNQIFKDNGDGSLSPIRPTRVGGVTISPGVTFAPGVSFAGIDFTKYISHDLEANEEDGVLVIAGIYE